jgi:molybdate transport system substrate-binding protein
MHDITSSSRRSFLRAAGFLALASMVSFAAVPVHAADGKPEVTVFAAASLTDALGEIAASYEKENGVHIVLNFGASSTLSRQIREGAPADLFLSADEVQMNALEGKKLLKAGSRRNVLSNSLVVVVPNDSELKIAKTADLASSRIRALALAEPQSVPAGVYAKEVLRRQGLWSKVIDRVVPTENVRAALAAVESGNVDAGIVYKTDAQISKKVKIAYEIPAAETPRILYPFAVLAEAKDAKASEKFLAYLESEAGLAVFRKYGFLIAAGS